MSFLEDLRRSFSRKFLNASPAKATSKPLQFTVSCVPQGLYTEPDKTFEFLNDTQQEPELCELCNKINFLALAHHRPYGGHEIGFHIPHGTLLALSKARHCRLCSFLWDEVKTKVTEQGIVVDQWDCSFMYELWKMKQPLITNFFKLVCYRHGDPPTLKDPNKTFLVALHPCTSPVPTVEEYGSKTKMVLEDAQTSKFSARLISKSGAVDYKLVSWWLRLCENVHGPKCHEKSVSKNLPGSFSVIDVERSCVIHAPKDCRYVALSYVWGTEPFLIATIANSETLSEDGALKDNLPATIRDAMTVTRAMGERYIWVDALCIVQDDDIHKFDQIECMDAIYAKSLFTIVAATGDRADAGLLGVNPTTKRTRQNIVYAKGLHMATALPVFNSNVAWLSRGWTLQEELLSRRVLHFSHQQVFWKCHTAEWQEDMVLEVQGLNPRYAGQRYFDDLELPYSLENDLNRAHTGFMSAYTATVTEYSARRLTLGSDMLNAYKAIEMSLSLLYQDRFFFGIPESCFTLAIVWSSRGMVRNTASCTLRNAQGGLQKTVFPTWSWTGWTFVGRRVEFVENPFTSVVFHRIDDNGRWVQIHERDTLYTRAAKLDRSHSCVECQDSLIDQASDHEVKKVTGDVVNLGLLRFCTEVLRIVPLEPDDDPPSVYIDSWIFTIERIGRGKPLRLKCVVDSKQALDLITLATTGTKRIRKQTRLPSYEAVAVGKDSHGRTVCLIVELDRSLAYRIGRLSVAEDDWNVSRRTRKMVTLG